MKLIVDGNQKAGYLLRMKTNRTAPGHLIESIRAAVKPSFLRTSWKYKGDDKINLTRIAGWYQYADAVVADLAKIGLRVTQAQALRAVRGPKNDGLWDAWQQAEYIAERAKPIRRK